MATMPAKSQRSPSSRLHQRFCENVRFWRKERDLTQIEVAKKLGMTQPQYCEIENGLKAPVLGTIERIAKALNVEPGDLLAPRSIVAA